MNSFELLGRINWMDLISTESGSVITKIILAKKKPKSDEYESFPITFFNTRNDNTAERLAEECKVGDYIRLKGQLGITNMHQKMQIKFKKKLCLQVGHLYL